MTFVVTLKKYMSTAVMEIYKALVEAGVSDKQAQEAAQSVISRQEAKEFATKSDLKAEVAQLKSSMIIWFVGLELATTALILSVLA